VKIVTAGGRNRIRPEATVSCRRIEARNAPKHNPSPTNSSWPFESG
jgi:hypothetical protein